MSGAGKASSIMCWMRRFEVPSSAAITAKPHPGPRPRMRRCQPIAGLVDDLSAEQRRSSCCGPRPRPVCILLQSPLKREPAGRIDDRRMPARMNPVPVPDPFGRHLPFELREGEQHVQLQPARAGRGHALSDRSPFLDLTSGMDVPDLQLHEVTAGLFQAHWRQDRSRPGVSTLCREQVSGADLAILHPRRDPCWR